MISGLVWLVYGPVVVGSLLLALLAYHHVKYVRPDFQSTVPLPSQYYALTNVGTSDTSTNWVSETSHSVRNAISTDEDEDEEECLAIAGGAWTAASYSEDNEDV